MVAARGRDGAIETFDVTENEHRDHIFKVSRVPAQVSDAVAVRKRSRGTDRPAFDYVGVLAVEMFVVRDGRSHRAGQRDRAAGAQFRPLDARRRSVSQFEQHIRAVAGWPLAKPVRHGRRVEMTNLIGSEVEDVGKWLTVPGAAVHLYGKAEVRPGCKMGHVMRVWTRGNRMR